MKILGLTGQAGAGKNYAAQKLRTFLRGRGVSVVEAAYADALRAEITEEIFGAHYSWPIGPASPETWRKPYSEAQRWILQHYGSEFRRAQDPYYWVNKMHDRLEDLYFKGVDFAIVTDLRFPNEAQLLQDLAGKVALVTAPYEVRQARLGNVPTDDGHRSEAEVYSINHDGVINCGEEGKVVIPAGLAEYITGPHIGGLVL